MAPWFRRRWKSCTKAREKVRHRGRVLARLLHRSRGTRPNGVARRPARLRRGGVQLGRYDLDEKEGLFAVMFLPRLKSSPNNSKKGRSHHAVASFACQRLQHRIG